uniref:Lipoyl-binding domain-containing protein n=1 Tax=Chlamydomonas leiostraca TaxID=1034604 RepID=A0A7S0S3S9_9CHLO|mmetsp:Transcript_7442/g.18471  ORF Transcript_7442/g.18471 Transcript_7442/m.18471 type:complete len:256 (+) Transcript_7442:86-853(+)|eukprot:CAMPEP_0202858836 /NCGR_PEP_ID=MMETSP1391-20130828/1196_1 /ASSEMBLY_ACC=CAM_ASM_000867 /TAXON_ID=1034604 /ORGANISM="Chlamydomonas leiostraca, Strain SAG 11-49" /LENGTH=255 /DNA_ID=CAMNT_0049537797 /DNA_START=61 /DNA_END=828 /DNA_ORIENTATION=-
MWALVMQPRMLHSQGAIGLLRALHTGVRTCMPDIIVPSLGESVSEGTISSVLKQPGDQVKVDETVAQLETDKVTIDCKSQYAGTVSEVLVKTGDVVKPGHRLVVVGEGAAAPSASASAPATAQSAASTSHAASGADSSSHGRTPAIKFPPRTTPDGQRISALPAAEADAVLAKILGAAPPTHAAPAAAAAAAAPPPPPPTSKPAAAAAGQPGPAQPLTVKGPPKSAATVYIEEQPSRRKLLPSEVDIINAGGAWP